MGSWEVGPNVLLDISPMARKDFPMGVSFIKEYDMPYSKV